MSIGNFCLTRIKKLTGGQAGRRLNKPEMGKNPQNKSTQKKKKIKSALILRMDTKTNTNFSGKVSLNLLTTGLAH